MEIKYCVLFIILLTWLAYPTLMMPKAHILTLNCLDNQCSKLSFHDLQPTEYTADEFKYIANQAVSNGTMPAPEYYYNIDGYTYPAFMQTSQKLIDYADNNNNNVIEEEYMLLGLVPYSKHMIVNVYTINNDLVYTLDFCNDDGICQRYEDIQCSDCASEFNVECNDPGDATDVQEQCQIKPDNSIEPITVNDIENETTVQEFQEDFDSAINNYEQTQKTQVCCLPILSLFCIFILVKYQEN